MNDILVAMAGVYEARQAFTRHVRQNRLDCACRFRSTGEVDPQCSDGLRIAGGVYGAMATLQFVESKAPRFIRTDDDVCASCGQRLDAHDGDEMLCRDEHLHPSGPAAPSIDAEIQRQVAKWGESNARFTPREWMECAGKVALKAKANSDRPDEAHRQLVKLAALVLRAIQATAPAADVGEAGRLAEALELVYWGEAGGLYCRHCKGYMRDGHVADCRVGEALAAYRKAGGQ